MHEETKKAILDELVDDGDTFKFDDGRWLRLKVECDQDTRVTDEEFWGDFAWPGRKNDYGHYERPVSFDGNAELLGFGRSYDRIWWQPPKGDYQPYVGNRPMRRDDPEFREMRQHVMDLLEYGYEGYVVELWHECPSCGSKHEERSASLWGIEWGADDGYKREVISDLLEELEV